MSAGSIVTPSPFTNFGNIGTITLDLINPLPNATVGKAYSQTVVRVITPESRYTYTPDTLASGNGVPTGMTLNINGILSGTPFATGAANVNGNQIKKLYTFGVCATDTISRLMTTPCPQTSITVYPPTCLNGAADYPTCTPPTCSNGATNYPTCTPPTCFNGATNYPTCTPPTCPNGATDYPTCTPPTCSNGAADYPTCTPPTCSNGGTNYPTCTPPTCSNGGTNYPTCTPPTCSNGATDYPTCTPLQSNVCHICNYDVYCTVYGAGGCWRCSNSTYSGGVCVGNGGLTFAGPCVADPSLNTVCQ